MITEDLPEPVQDIVRQQGWNNDSLIIHLMRFIENEELTQSLVKFLDEQAIEENQW